MLRADYVRRDSPYGYLLFSGLTFKTAFGLQPSGQCIAFRKEMYIQLLEGTALVKDRVVEGC